MTGIATVLPATSSRSESRMAQGDTHALSISTRSSRNTLATVSTIASSVTVYIECICSHHLYWERVWDVCRETVDEGTGLVLGVTSPIRQA